MGKLPAKGGPVQPKSADAMKVQAESSTGKADANTYQQETK